jgi:hypothetical protein
VRRFLEEDLRNGDDTSGSSPSVAAATAVAFTAIVSSAARLARSLRFIRGGENPEAALPYFWKIFDFYFEISNFMLDFPTPIST